ncbi:MAG TPA: cohesin domain-containing protein [Candidatus Limnocylindria bacterium]|nr:cohesin domain-containing protein [Candidatus Limnocylindria bacterium]
MKYIQPLSKFKAGLVVVLAIAFIGAALLQHSLAATGKIYLSPSSASVLNGSNVKLALRITPGTAVDGVEATLTYDKAKLQFVSIDSGSSAFSIQLQQSGGNGTVQVSRGLLGGTVSSDALIASVTFKALTGSGTTSPSVSGNATAGGAYTNPAGGSATVALKSSATQPKPTPNPPANNDTDTGGSNDNGSGGSTGQPSGNQGSQGGSGGTSKPNASKPTLEVKQKSIQLTKAIILISSNKKVQVSAQFGTDKERLSVSTPITKFNKEHQLAFNQKLLIPGTTYYYQVTAEDEQGNKTTSEVQSFKTKGYRVTFILMDKLERLMRKKKVTLHSDPMTGTTNDNGQVTFDNVAPGGHTLEYTVDKQTYKQSVDVPDQVIKESEDGTQIVDPQSVPAVFRNVQVTDSNSRTLIVPIGVSLAVLLVAGAGAYVFISRRRQQPVGLAAGVIQSPAPVAPPTPQTPEDYLQSRGPGQEPDPGAIVRPQQIKESKDKDQG